MSQITSLLSVIGQGDMTLIDTTSLVHWSFLRFEKSRAVDIGGRAQFIAHAPRVMRSVVVDAVRRRHSERGGGGAAHVEFDEAVAEQAQVAVDPRENEVLRVHFVLLDKGSQAKHRQLRDLFTEWP